LPVVSKQEIIYDREVAERCPFKDNFSPARSHTVSFSLDHDERDISMSLDDEDNHLSSLQQLTTDLAERVIRQVEYWLSDENLKTDEYILKKLKNGWISIKLLTTFKKMKRLTKDHKFIAHALRHSDKLVLNKAGTQVSRKVPFVLEEALCAELRTVMAKNLPETIQLEELKTLFSECGAIQHANIVQPRNNQNHKKKSNEEVEKPKSPYAFIRFEELESAITACEFFSNHKSWRAAISVCFQSGLSPEDSRKRYLELRETIRRNESERAVNRERSISSFGDSISDDDSSHGGKVSARQGSRDLLSKITSASTSDEDDGASSVRSAPRSSHPMDMNGTRSRTSSDWSGLRRQKENSTSKNSVRTRSRSPSKSNSKWRNFGRSNQPTTSNASCSESRTPSPDTWRSNSNSRVQSPSNSRQNSSVIPDTSASPSSDELQIGVIHSYFGDCGFIKPEKKKAAKTVYFSSKHVVGNARALKAGDRVEYKVKYDKKTHEPCAYTVKRVEGVILVDDPKDARLMASQRVQAKGPDGSRGFSAGRGRTLAEGCVASDQGLLQIEAISLNFGIKT
jgi:La-related protein 7